MSVHIESHGSGDDVVLLHGVPVPPSHFSPFVEAFADSHRCWVVHLPGYGQSPSLSPGFGVEDVERLVEEALVEHGVETATFLGYSGGGYHALALALRGRVRAHGVISLGGLASLAHPERDGFRELARLLRGGLSLNELLPSRHLSEGFASTHPKAVAEVLTWVNATGIDSLVAELEAFSHAPDLLEPLRDLRAPVLARVGELDVSCPVAKSEAIVGAAPNATLEVVPNVGHALLIEDFAGTCRSIRSWLAARG